MRGDVKESINKITPKNLYIKHFMNSKWIIIHIRLDIRTKQSIEIENFFDWIGSTQSKSGGGSEVADQKKVTSVLGTIAPLIMVQFGSNKV